MGRCHGGTKLKTCLNNKMSQTYIAVIINLLVVVLPLLGIQVGGEELTITIQTITAVITGIWIMIRRYRSGGINIAGVRTNG